MSERSKRNRKLLLWRIVVLALGYAAPLGGLAFFFSLSGVRQRLAALEREQVGVRYIRELARVHDSAVQQIWAPRTGGAAPDLDAALVRLAALEHDLAPQLSAAKYSNQTDDLTAAQLRAAWRAARDATDPTEQAEEIILFLGQIHAHLANATDVSGLNSSPDLETEYVADTVAAALPVHVERLLQMHEQLLRLAPQERALSEHLSAVFLRQLDKELPRLERGVARALVHDARSAHLAPEFQRVFPPAARAFSQSIEQLAADLRADGNDAAYWDRAFGQAYLEAMRFWNLAIDQLDVLIRDQIDQARHERNLAITVAVLLVVTLLPLTWAYYRRYLRPLVQDLVDEVRENAEASIREKNQFLAMMSHEIRTPMNGVLGFAQLLADTKLDDQQRDYLRTILVSGESLLVVINDILDFSKLEAGKTELENQPLTLRLLIEDVLELLGTQARGKGLELVYWIDADVPERILGDAPRLRQVLLNLAGNAVKFTTAGHVEIVVNAAISPGGTRLNFHVRDTGIGIPPERLNRLFKAFSQVDVSISRTFGGTGLGLAISQKLVELMGGTIGVTSTPGQGSDFHFVLPVEATREPAPGVGSPEAPQGDIDQGLRDRTILVVDDLEANRRLVERFLVLHGARVVLADSADAALAAAARQVPDLAVLDYMMPGKHGVELAQELRRDHPALPLILLTSVPPDRAENAARFFETILLKPIRHLPFVTAVARALAPAASKAAPTTPAAPTAHFAANHPLNILVVDDNAVNLKVISATLRAYGYAPATHSDAASALAALQAHPFDLVLMDIQMPDMDGLAATRAIRAGQAGPRNRQIRIIALTAGATAEERAACYDAGMDDFLAKPISRPELLAKLAATIPSARKND